MYDIAFTLKFITDDGHCHEIEPYARLMGQKSGSYTPQASGQMLFCWDNSYSWMSTKKVKYKVSARGSFDFGKAGQQRGDSPREKQRKEIQAAAAVAAVSAATNTITAEGTASTASSSSATTSPSASDHASSTSSTTRPFSFSAAEFVPGRKWAKK